MPEIKLDNGAPLATNCPCTWPGPQSRLSNMVAVPAVPVNGVSQHDKHDPLHQVDPPTQLEEELELLAEQFLSLAGPAVRERRWDSTNKLCPC